MQAMKMKCEGDRRKIVGIDPFCTFQHYWNSWYRLQLALNSTLQRNILYLVTTIYTSVFPPAYLFCICQCPLHEQVGTLYLTVIFQDCKMIRSTFLLLTCFPSEHSKWRSSEPACQTRGNFHTFPPGSRNWTALYFNALTQPSAKCFTNSATYHMMSDIIRSMLIV